MSSETEKKKGGRPPVLKPEHGEVLRELVQARPACTLEELRQAFIERSGVQISAPTLREGLRQAGITRQVAQRAAPGPGEAQARPEKRRYGYSAAHRDAGDEQRYGSCLTDAEWALVADLFEPQDPRGRPPKHTRRHMVNACCYVLRTGCAWRQMPKEFPSWSVVHRTFSRWAAQGKFEQAHDRLREQWRSRIGKQAQPTAAVLDSQSTRISPQGGDSGYDAGKKVKGRKRNLVVDTCGLLLAVVVSAASVQDRDAAQPAMELACAKYPGLQKLYVDGAYGGKCAEALHAAHGLEVEVVRRVGSAGQWTHPQLPLFEPSPAFQVLPKRWIVERTHAWNERFRRLIMHHDRSIAISQAWVWFAEARILARRLTT